MATAEVQPAEAVSAVNESTAVRTPNYGAILSVRGTVVDVHFERDLPPIYTVLRAGAKKQIVIEVMEQLDLHSVRGIALTTTQDLARGMQVEDTGSQLKVPVGKNILSRMFDVLGFAINHKPAPTDVQWRDVHRPPPPLSERSTKAEIFETGIKAIDVLSRASRVGTSIRIGSPSGRDRRYSLHNRGKTYLGKIAQLVEEAHTVSHFQRQIFHTFRTKGLSG